MTEPFRPLTVYFRETGTGDVFRAADDLERRLVTEISPLARYRQGGEPDPDAMEEAGATVELLVKAGTGSRELCVSDSLIAGADQEMFLDAGKIFSGKGLPDPGRRENGTRCFTGLSQWRSGERPEDPAVYLTPAEGRRLMTAEKCTALCITESGIRQALLETVAGTEKPVRVGELCREALEREGRSGIDTVLQRYAGRLSERADTALSMIAGGECSVTFRPELTGADRVALHDPRNGRVISDHGTYEHMELSFALFSWCCLEAQITELRRSPADILHSVNAAVCASDLAAAADQGAEHVEWSVRQGCMPEIAGMQLALIADRGAAGNFREQFAEFRRSGEIPERGLLHQIVQTAEKGVIHTAAAKTNQKGGRGL